MTEIANVDLKCAVKATAFFRNARNLPNRGDLVPWMVRPRDRAGRLRAPVTIKGVGNGPNRYKGKRFIKEYITPKEMLRIIDAIPVETIYGRRDRALIVTLWRTGLRIQCEALRVMPHEVDLEEMTIFVRDGKGSKSRTVVMDEFCRDELAYWMAERAELPAGPLFCVCEGSTKGMGMGAPHMRRKYKEYAEKAGIQKRPWLHGLRMCCAVDLARDYPMHYVQEQLGHASVATTSIYVSGTPKAEIRNALAARPHPGAMA